MTPELSRRIARAMSLGSARPDERDALRIAAGSPEIKTEEDLPISARRILRRLDARAEALRVKVSTS